MQTSTQCLPWTDTARTLGGTGLAAALRESRERTWSLVNDLSPDQWLPACQAGINPVSWELAHLAWFAEFWILRGPHRADADGLVHATRPPRHLGPDALLDSARRAHADRWTASLPARAALRARMQDQLDACVAAIPHSGGALRDDVALYFHRLALFHEDMHAEALLWMRAALGYRAPVGLCPPEVSAACSLAVPEGTAIIGWPAGTPGFAFDNEQPAQFRQLSAFEIDSTPVRASDYARFVDAGGYDQTDHWPGAAGAWRSGSGRSYPQHWRREGNGGSGGNHKWQMRWFDQWVDVVDPWPVMHVNAYEAQAYCHWVGRRLPTAAEWEHAACYFGGAFHWGHSVWEWTADEFARYDGFGAGPYRAYSEPWFGTHRELRGGAFATHARMHHVRYRNFFQPHRSDIFAGFRTVAR